MSYVDELLRGYQTNSELPRVQSGTASRVNLDPWLSDDHKTRIDLYAQRNGELHVLCHEMLTALEYLDCDYDVLHKFRERLHNVPQCRHDPA